MNTRRGGGGKVAGKFEEIHSMMLKLSEAVHSPLAEIWIFVRPRLSTLPRHSHNHSHHKHV